MQFMHEQVTVLIDSIRPFFSFGILLMMVFSSHVEDLEESRGICAENPTVRNDLSTWKEAPNCSDVKHAEKSLMNATLTLTWSQSKWTFTVSPSIYGRFSLCFHFATLDCLVPLSIVFCFSCSGCLFFMAVARPTPLAALSPVFHQHVNSSVKCVNEYYLYSF